jgi:hypothetical protein
MRTVTRILVGVVGAAVLVLTACGGAGTAGSSSTPSAGPEPVPTAEQLAAMLVTPESLGGTWGAAPGPEGETAPLGGVVTEEQRAMLPRIDMCDAAPASARTAAEEVAWQAFTQVSMTPDDPLDMAGGDRVGHMIFAQEFLLGEEPAQVQATFEALRAGMAACMGPMPTEDADGHTGVSEEWAAPSVGDATYGVLMTVQEPGGGSRGTWLLRNALVRDGPVLMMIDVVEITVGEGVQPELSEEEIDAIVATAAERIA